MIIVNENTLEITSFNENGIPEDKSALSIYDELYNALGCDPTEFAKKYKKYKKAEEEFEAIYKPFKEKLLKIYEKTPDLAKTIIAGEKVKLTYVSPSVRTTIDTKKLKEEEPSLAKKYSKTTNVAGTFRLEEV